MHQLVYQQSSPYLALWSFLTQSLQSSRMVSHLVSDLFSVYQSYLSLLINHYNDQNINKIEAFINRGYSNILQQTLVQVDRGSDNILTFRSMEIEPATSLAQMKILQLPTRNKGSYTKRFREIKLETNYFPVQINNIQKLLIFKVKFDPPIPFENCKKRDQLLKDNLNILKQHIKSPVISGMNIFSAGHCTSEQFDFEAGSHKVSIKLVKTFDLANRPNILLAFLNNGLRNIMGKLGYVEIGKTTKFFNSQDKELIQSANVFIYSGYKPNFLFLEGGYFLRVDSAKKIVRNEKVIDYIDKLYKQNEGKDKAQIRSTIVEKLFGQTIMSNYGKTRYYRIIDINFQLKAASVIVDKNTNQNMSDYYRKKYGLQLSKPKQPLLEVQNKLITKKGAIQDPNKFDKIFLLPQFCLLTGLPQNVDENVRREITTKNSRNVDEKKGQIYKLLNSLSKTAEIQQLRQLGIKLNSKGAQIKSQIIPTPVLQLGQNHRVQRNPTNFQLFKEPLYHGKHAVKCGIIAQKQTDLNQMIDLFEKTAKNYQVSFEYEYYHYSKSSKVSRNNVDDKAVEQMIDKCSQNQVNLCLIVLVNNKKQSYQRLKKYAIKGQMMTQMVTTRKIFGKGAQSVFTKILLQIIAKRGNTLWVSKAPSQLQNLMLIGFDTAKYKNSTIVTVCSTLNSTYTSIFTDYVMAQSNDKFKQMVNLTIKSIGQYMARNQRHPKQIILLSHAVGKSQVEIYHEHFIRPLEEHIKKSLKTDIKLTVVLVNVKTVTRLFYTEGNNGTNAPVGTLISSSIVSQNYDFYLLNQQSKNAIAPNHFEVIYTTTKMQEGILEELLFGQCFNYVNWTGVIKVPSVLQYAKKNCKFVAEFIQMKEVPELLKKKLYYI